VSVDWPSASKGEEVEVDNDKPWSMAPGSPFCSAEGVRPPLVEWPSTAVDTVQPCLSARVQVLGFTTNLLLGGAAAASMSAAAPATLATQGNSSPFDAACRQPWFSRLGVAAAIGDATWPPKAGWFLMPMENALLLARKQRNAVTIPTDTWKPRTSLWPPRPTWWPCVAAQRGMIKV